MKLLFKDRHRIRVRRAELKDIPGILRVEREAWGEDQAATEEEFRSRIETFSKGVMVATREGEIIGVVVVERVDYDIEKDSYSWYEITDNGFIKNSHKPEGESLYGVDLSVSPHFQGMGIGTKLLKEVSKLAIRLNLKSGLLGGRIPDYHKYSDKMSVEEYIKETTKTKKGIEPLDSELRFYKRAGLKIVKVIPDYFEDPESLNYGVLLLWENPFYNKWYRELVLRTLSLIEKVI